MINDTEDICWDILDILFEKGGSPETSNQLVKHQIHSYNKFLDTTLGHIISGFNPIKISIPTKNDFINENNYKISINVINPSLTKPSYHLLDGTHTILSPYIARMNNLTYSSSLYVNVHVIIETVNSDGIIEKFDKTVNNVYIGKIPIMVRSKACLLYQVQAIGELSNNECKYDYGGYFIVNGNEKVLISQDRINENKTDDFYETDDENFTYWCFKKRVEVSEPSKLASDTKKGTMFLYKLLESESKRIILSKSTKTLTKNKVDFVF